jgi:hypothetical protein
MACPPRTLAANGGAGGSGVYEAISFFRLKIVPADGIRLPFSARRPRYLTVFGQLSVKAICLTARQHTIFAA